MKRRSHLHLLILLVPALLFSCTGDEGGGTGTTPPPPAPETPLVAGVSAEAAPQDELSLLCPEGALVFVRFNDLGSLEKEVHDLAKSVDPSDQNVVILSQMIGDMFMNPTMEGVDLERPLGVALFDGGMGNPMPIFLIPVTSEQEFRAVYESNPNWPHMKDSIGLAFPGKWAVFAMDPSMADGIELREAPIPMAARMLAGDVSLTVDLVAINELVGPELDKLAENPGAMPPGAEMFGGMMEGMLDGVKKFLADSEYLNISATMRDGAVSLTVKYGASDGSWTGNKLAQAEPKKPELIHSLGTNGLFVAEFYMRMDDLWDLYEPLYKVMFAEKPELLELMEKGFTLADGGAMGMSIKNGMQMVALSHLRDPEGYQQYYAEMMSKMSEVMDSMKDFPGLEEMPMTFEMLPGWKHGDVDVSTMKIGMDFSGMPAMPPEANMIMDQFFGPDGMHVQTCMVGELGLSTIGDADMKALIDRIGAGETVAMPAAFTEATAGFPEKVNGIFYLNLGEMAPWIGDLAKEQLKPAQSALLQSPPPDLWYAGYVRTEGPTVTLGLSMKLGQMVKYVSAIMQSE